MMQRFFNVDQQIVALRQFLYQLTIQRFDEHVRHGGIRGFRRLQCRLQHGAKASERLLSGRDGEFR